MPLPHLPLVTMFFKTGETGWSESHVYMTAPTGSPRPIYGIVPIATALATARAGMLAYNIILYRIRASWLDVWRDSVYPTPPTISLGAPNSLIPNIPYYNFGGAVLPPGDPWDVASFRLEETELYRGEEVISGYPDGMLSQNLTFPFGGAYASYSDPTKAYFNLLTGCAGPGQPSAGGPWGTLVRVKAGDGATAQTIVSIAYTAGPPFGWIFTLTAPPTVTPGQAVRVLGVTQNPANPKTKYNGTWNVLSVTGNTFTVAYPLAGPTYIAYCTDATATPIVLQARAYTNWLFDGTTHRKRGVPSDRPHGRRKRSVPTAVV